MRILVDADACPVKKEILAVAKEYKLEVHMYFDNSHEYEDGYSTVYIMDTGADSVDYALINASKVNDVIITQDYGVATMALSKKAFPINQNGLVYNDDNIMGLLSQRAMNQKLRKHKKMKGPRKRTQENNIQFKKQLINLINSKI